METLSKIDTHLLALALVRAITHARTHAHINTYIHTHTHTHKPHKNHTHSNTHTYKGQRIYDRFLLSIYWYQFTWCHIILYVSIRCRWRWYLTRTEPRPRKRLLISIVNTVISVWNSSGKSVVWRIWTISHYFNSWNEVRSLITAFSSKLLVEIVLNRKQILLNVYSRYISSRKRHYSQCVTSECDNILILSWWVFFPYPILIQIHSVFISNKSLTIQIRLELTRVLFYLTGRLRGLIDSAVGHRSIALGFKPQQGYVRGVFHLSLRLITVGDRSYRFIERYLIRQFQQPISATSAQSVM